MSIYVVRFRGAGFVSGLVLVGSLVGAAPAAGVAGFGDVRESRYFTNAVQWMVDEGITTGVAPNCFAPRRNTSRGDAAVFLWRAQGQPSADPHPFTDITAAYQQAAVSWLFAAGITTGTSPTTFDPDQMLTRAQLAVMLHRLANTPTGFTHPFTDVSAPYDDAIGWLHHAGITTGTTPTTFSPDEPVTRAQMATFLYRFEGAPAVDVAAYSPGCPWITDYETLMRTFGGYWSTGDWAGMEGLAHPDVVAEARQWFSPDAIFEWPPSDSPSCRVPYPGALVDTAICDVELVERAGALHFELTLHFPPTLASEETGWRVGGLERVN